MLRSLLLSALSITACSQAVAQTSGGPPIAYVKFGGTTQDLYLVNPDGSGARKLYSAPRKFYITTLDLKPGGGEIAFVERASGSPVTLKVLSFTAAGVAIGNPRSLAMPCAPDYIDYHPTAPKLIFSAICGTNSAIGTIDTNGSNFAIVRAAPTQTNWHGQPRWKRDGTYLYVYSNDPVAYNLCRNDCVGADSVYFSSSQIGRIDVGRLGDTVLIDTPVFYISEIDGSSGAMLRSNFLTGRGGHYSADDKDVLYLSNHSASGDYLLVYHGDTGITTRLTTKGDFGPFDWRN